jgi:hypothetical protein
MIYAITLILLALSGMFESAPAAGCDPALAGVFAPARPRFGTYEVCTTDEMPAQVLSREGFQSAEPERLEVLDALGAAGDYDRSRAAQLFNGRRVDVRRGWRVLDGRFESMTTLSPYPDASLTSVQNGTLVIRWTVTLKSEL